ncbi:hypothetical protein B0H17DRAFT_893076, partial [Mycena rosella]
GFQIGETMPCGFCGRSGRPECQIFMKPNKTVSQTKCPYQTDFRYKTADTGTDKTACRNVPILCGLCPPKNEHDWTPAVWRYNMAEHLRVYHSEYASPQQPEGLLLPFAVWEKIAITHKEEKAQGVLEFLIP